MRRREFLSVLVGAAAARPFEARAQPSTKLWRIGILFSRSLAQANVLPDFRKGIESLGYVDGRDFILELRYADGQYARLEQFAHELTELGVDVIVAQASPAIRAAQKATKTIPIVMSPSGDPVTTGLVASLAHPGGNTTGLSILSPDVGTKQLQLLTAMIPKLSRLGLLLNRGSSTREAFLRVLQHPATAHAIDILPVDAETVPELENGLAEFARRQVEAVIVMPDTFLIQQGPLIADLASKLHLPSIAIYREFAQTGGLMSYGPNLSEIWREASRYVDRILRGGNPANIPVEQPTKFELVINLRTAKAIGIQVPDSQLALADQVIE